jgi:hypothetical protein
VLNGTTKVPVVVQSLRLLLKVTYRIATLARSTGDIDVGAWLGISCQYFSCSLMCGLGIAFSR